MNDWLKILLLSAVVSPFVLLAKYFVGQGTILINLGSDPLGVVLFMFAGFIGAFIAAGTIGAHVIDWIDKLFPQNQ